MRFYKRKADGVNKVEITIYPQELEDEVGIALRLTKQELRLLQRLLEEAEKDLNGE